MRERVGEKGERRKKGNGIDRKVGELEERRNERMVGI